jgi:hypothetical protein
MNGLRVYINPVEADALKEKRVFYSRRADGPFYCWRYEEEPGQWRSSRVRPSDWLLKDICMASWKIVPTALQTRIGEHYLE